MTRVPPLVAALVGSILLAGAQPIRVSPHPRIWLTPAVLSALRAKAAADDPDWRQLKAAADRLLTRRMPRFAVTAATNANPVEFTLADPVPWSGSAPMFIAGGTGRWSVVNSAGDRPMPIAATRTGSNTFAVPIDARALGSFAGQRLVLFFSEGGYSNYGYQGSDWQSTLEVLCLAYQVTGIDAYAVKAGELVDYIASLGAAGMLAPAAIDSGYPSRTTIYSLAIAYDWLHDRLTPQQKATVGRALTLWFDWFKRAAFENTGSAYGNYFGGHVLGFGLAGLAIEGDIPRGAEIAAHIRSLFDANVPAAFATGGFAGGFPVEGHSYGAAHFQRLLSYMLAAETATNADVSSRRAYAQKIARNLLYNLKPNNWQVSDEGAYAGDYTGVLSPALPIVLSSLLAGTDEGRWMEHLHRHLAAAPHGGQTASAFVRFLYADRTRPAEDYRRTQPLWHRSPGDDHFYRRSSWEPDAVWTSVAAGSAHWAGHQMRGAGHLAIQRGNDYLLVNSGQWKGPAGDYGSPQAFDLRSWRSNTLFVDDFGEYLLPDDDYRGGQGPWGTSRVLAHDGSPDFGYIKTDLTAAYNAGDRKPWAARSVRAFYRSVLSMGTGVVVLFDRVQFSKANYVKKLYFHLNPSEGPPAIAGTTASIRAGASALFIRTLLPAAPVLAVAADPVSAADSRAITYRLEVSDSVAATTFDALHVLVAGPSSPTEMPATVRLQSVNSLMAGAMVNEGGVQRVGLFSTDGTPHTTVQYVADYPSGQTGVHVIADVIPSTQYDITRDGVAVGVARATTQGVLTFRCAGGGLFAIATRAAGTRPLIQPPRW